MIPVRYRGYKFFKNVMQTFQKVKRPSLPAFCFLKCSLAPDSLLLNTRHPPFSLPQMQSVLRDIYIENESGKGGGSESWKIPHQPLKVPPSKAMEDTSFNLYLSQIFFYIFPFLWLSKRRISRIWTH